ncbi:MAG: transglutaminase-like domain-containing protein [Propionibacteriaceae bacterium]|jgi:hypothetical protein|nr:transglutaminase-like domain-containing protein [Propionibacteriaceae bacterium]
MRVVNPDTSPTRAHGVTTTRWVKLLPTSRALVEAGFAAVTSLTALIGLCTTFDSWLFMAVVGLGVLIAALVTHAVRVAGWHWTIGLAAVLGAYVLLGGPVAVRQGLIWRIIPSGQTFQDLWTVSIHGWKQLLTTIPPVDGSGSFLALPFLMALVFTAGSYGLARSHRVAGLPLIPAGALFVLSILIGAEPWTYVSVQAIVWVGAGLAWTSYRASRRQLVGHSAGVGSGWRWSVMALVMMVVAAAVAGVVGPHWPGVQPPRLLLRDLITPPVDLNEYPSPMPSFRKFSSSALQETYFYDDPLLTVEGASPGALIRFTVLDSWDGLVWGAADTSFRRVGAVIPVSDTATEHGSPVDLRITVEPVYAEQAPLNVWAPNLGEVTAISFDGSTARGHAESMAYDLTKGQPLVLDQLRAGDQLQVSSLPVDVAPVDGSRALVPSGVPLVSDSVTEFLSEDMTTILGGAGSPWEQIQALAASFRQGGWTDGTTRANESKYTPGDGEYRLRAFMSTLPAYVGSDEQYAAAFALIANRIGFPARVVFGAAMPSQGDQIMGKDVTIWVELGTTDGWVALPPQFFIPPRDQAPNPPPPAEVTPPQEIPNIAQQGPQLPPDTTARMDTQAQTTPPRSATTTSLTWWQVTLIGVAGVVFGVAALIGVLIGVKALRSAIRRRSGSNAARIAAGWSDVMDRARDVGLRVPRAGTRSEQAAAMGLAGLEQLASSTNRAMFQPTPPDQAIVSQYWDEVAAEKSQLLSSRTGLARFWARITPRSFCRR